MNNYFKKKILQEIKKNQWKLNKEYLNTFKMEFKLK